MPCRHRRCAARSRSLRRRRSRRRGAALAPRAGVRGARCRAIEAARSPRELGACHGRRYAIVRRRDAGVAPRTRAWQMRIDLEHGPGAARWTRCAHPELRRLGRAPTRASPASSYRKRVGGLAAPAAYRAVVRFRWRDAARQGRRAAPRTTAACRSPTCGPTCSSARDAGSRARPGASWLPRGRRQHGRRRGRRRSTSRSTSPASRQPVHRAAAPAGRRRQRALVDDRRRPRCAAGDRGRVTRRLRGTRSTSRARTDNAARRRCAVARPAGRPTPAR